MLYSSGQGDWHVSEFPTGGDSPRAARLIWCNSKTDSKVWMIEERCYEIFVPRIFVYPGLFDWNLSDNEE